ncbi:phage tail protein [Nocardiopsis gilva YIM 90087]|uniref:Phage tail protein n=1 Tax=Nocardiopsis gilva YIM 90087 TaxID=1235441 RepID=A0A223S643_9ACTN|nr:phage tail domain-containing protein [Nocardiopsis gilva]ASU83586.1 phage tail protein [Nocardiopsis gilva YIM 90087]
MPLLHIPPETAPPEPPGFPKVPVAPGKRIVWIAPDGTELGLSDGDPYISVTGRSGFGAVRPEHVVDRTMSGTALLRDVRVTPRVMRVPLIVQAGDADAYLAAYRTLTASTRHKTGATVTAGTLRVELPDGSWRQITAYYQDGLDPHETELDDLMWSRQEHPSLEFYAPDPFFEGPEVTQAWKIVISSRAFYPIYPITVNPSQLGGSATFTNAGDADAYPIWEITGPGTPVVTNSDTGESWGFDTALGIGEVVTVDTRPPDIAPETGLTAVSGGGTDWWPNFAGFPELFLLPPGETSLQITMTGADEGSQVRLTYRPRYRAGW